MNSEIKAEVTQGEACKKPAYIDSFGGLIPCMVVQISRNADGRAVEVHYKPTVTCGGYRKGSRETSTPMWVVPRAAVYKPRGSFSRRILPYAW